VSTPPPGAQWAVGHGCGTTIEGAKDQNMVKCGMGYVPALSSRFLSFYAGAAE
jgi:hypothetical protein